MKKQLVIDDTQITLQIWDSGGQERYKSASKQFLKKAQGIVLVFDLSSQFSFEGMVSWLTDIENEAAKDLPIVLVGNKSDLPERVVSYEEVSKFANDKKLKYFETSALTGDNIDKTFLAIAKLVWKQRHSRKERGGVTLTNQKQQKKCC